MTDNLRRIKNFCVEGKMRWTSHIMTRLLQRGISLDDIKDVIKTGEIIEDYPDDYPYPSCLILGKNLHEEYFHVVCGLGEEEIWLITAYKPSVEKWGSDLKTRKAAIQ